MNELEAQTANELQQILAAVRELTGLASRWSGRVELIAGAEFKGRKRFSCDIQLDEALARLPQRWPTLIHEALHAVSAGYVATDYRSFPGWEEGVVEKLQRLLRPTILNRVGVHVDDTLGGQDDPHHLYNAYIDALEELRLCLGLPAETFYLDLLRTPLRARPSFIFGMGNARSGQERLEFVRLFSASNSVLKGVLRGEPGRAAGGGPNEIDSAGSGTR